VQKPVLSAFRLGNCGPVNLIAVPDLKSTLYSPNQGVLHLKVFDTDRPGADCLYTNHSPTVAPDQKMLEQVVAHITNDYLWNHFFPGLTKANRSYLLSVEYEDGKMRISIVVGSQDAFKKLGLGIHG
jgi:hypothetical protein